MIENEKNSFESEFLFKNMKLVKIYENYEIYNILNIDKKYK